MVYNLPTISSLNRVRTTHRPVRERRDPPPPAGVCEHRVTLFGGRCPVCYRISIRAYGTRIRRQRPRPPHRPTVPTLPRIQRPSVPITTFAPRAPFPRPPPRQSPFPRPYVPSYTSNISMKLPGITILRKKTDETCPVCMDDYTKNTVCQLAPCGHKFHQICFAKWIMRKYNCPVCRQDFTVS